MCYYTCKISYNIVFSECILTALLARERNYCCSNTRFYLGLTLFHIFLNNIFYLEIWSFSSYYVDDNIVYVFRFRSILKEVENDLHINSIIMFGSTLSLVPRKVNRPEQMSLDVHRERTNY